jgi:iron-sulfur cluster insertion protein
MAQNQTPESAAGSNPPPQSRPGPVTVSESAARRIGVMLSKEGNPDLKLRVSVSGGGCSGFQYGFDFDDTAQADDTVIEDKGVTVLIDSMSLLYLIGSEIDFVEDLVGASFQIKNPNAASSCGCGSSFSI